MRKVFLVLVGLVFLATIVLLFLAGMGAFDAAPRADSFEPHRLVARATFGLSLLTIAAAALARVPGRVLGLTAVITGLMLLQFLIALVSQGFEDQNTALANLVFGLHAINGLVTMGVARTVFVRARGLVGAGPAAAAPAAATAPAGS